MSFGSVTNDTMGNLIGFARSHGGDYEFIKQGNKIVKRKASGGRRGGSKRSKKNNGSVVMSDDSLMYPQQSYSQSWAQSAGSLGSYQPLLQQPFGFQQIIGKFTGAGSKNPMEVSRDISRSAAVAGNLSKLQNVVRKSYKPAGEYFNGTYCPAPFMPRGVCLKSVHNADGSAQWELSKDGDCWTAQSTAAMNNCGMRGQNDMPYGSDYSAAKQKALSGENSGAGAIVMMPNKQMYQFKEMRDQFGNFMYRWVPMPPGTNPTYLQFMGFKIMEPMEVAPDANTELDVSKAQSWEFFGLFSGLTGNVINNVLMLIQSDDPETVARSYTHAESQNRMNVDVAADYKFVAGFMALVHEYLGKKANNKYELIGKSWDADATKYANYMNLLQSVWDQADQVIRTHFETYSNIKSDVADVFKNQVDAWRAQKARSYVSHPSLMKRKNVFAFYNTSYISRISNIAAKYAVCYDINIDRQTGIMGTGSALGVNCTWNEMLNEIKKTPSGIPPPPAPAGANVPSIPLFDDLDDAYKNIVEGMNKQIAQINNGSIKKTDGSPLSPDELKKVKEYFIKEFTPRPTNASEIKDILSNFDLKDEVGFDID